MVDHLDLPAKLFLLFICRLQVCFHLLHIILMANMVNFCFCVLYIISFITYNLYPVTWVFYLNEFPRLSRGDSLGFIYLSEETIDLAPLLFQGQDCSESTFVDSTFCGTLNINLFWWQIWLISVFACYTYVSKGRREQFMSPERSLIKQNIGFGIRR